MKWSTQIKRLQRNLESLFKFWRRGASSITPRSFLAQMFRICGVNLRRQARSRHSLSASLEKLRGQATQISARLLTALRGNLSFASNKGADLRRFEARLFRHLSPSLNKSVTQSVRCLVSAKTPGLIILAQNTSGLATKSLMRLTSLFLSRLICRPSFQHPTTLKTRKEIYA